MQIDLASALRDNCPMSMATAKDHASHTRRETLAVCIVDDEPSMVEMLQTAVEQMGYRAAGTTDPEEALEQARAGRCRVVLSDLKMPMMDGLTLLERALQHDPGIHVILMTGFYSLDSAIEAIKRGAYDYLPKPVDRSRLKKTLDELAELYDQRKRIRDLEEQLLADLEFHGIVGKSPAMLEVFDLARKVAKHYTNVLLTGPTGSGKELVARAIHQMSPVGSSALRRATVRRWWTPCSKANCSAMSVAPSPGPPTPGPACLNTPPAAPSSWTRSERCRCPCRPSCCA